MNPNTETRRRDKVMAMILDGHHHDDHVTLACNILSFLLPPFGPMFRVHLFWLEVENSAHHSGISSKNVMENYFLDCCEHEEA